MTHEHESLDITNNPELMRIVEEVRRSNTPLELRGHDQVVAIVMPPPIARQTDTDTDADIRQAKRDLHMHFGSVTPHARPEDFTALRREFEERAAEDARTRGQQ